MDDTNIITDLQKDLKLGNRVLITLMNGHVRTGVLRSIGLDYIELIKEDGHSAKIRIQMIGTWETISSEERLMPNKKNPPGNDGAKKTELTNIKINNLSTEHVIDEETNKTNLSTAVEQKVTENKTNVDIDRLVMKIEFGFKAKIENTRLALVVPDFHQHYDKLKSEWQKIEQSYTHAKKINELDAKFGRTQQISRKIENLINNNPFVPQLRSILGYLYFLLKEKDKGLKQFEMEIKYFRDSLTVDTLLNASVLALECEAPLKSLFFLELLFAKNHPSSYSDAWYVFLDLLLKTKNTAILHKLNCEDSEQLFYESLIYILLEETSQKNVSTAINISEKTDIKTKCFELLDSIPKKLSSEYHNIHAELRATNCKLQPIKPKEKKDENKVGKVKFFKVESGYGFIAAKDKEYFFHIYNVTDPELKSQLSIRFVCGMAVEFKLENGTSFSHQNGLVAVDIKLVRNTDALYQLSVEYANKGDYSNALLYIEKVLEQDKKYPNADKLLSQIKDNQLDQTKEQKLKINHHIPLPKGKNVYSLAKREDLTGDLDNALRLYQKAIDENDHKESAVKDLAMLLSRLNRDEDAIKLLEEYWQDAQDKTKVGNLLATLYEKTNNAEKLNKLLSNYKDPRKKEFILWKLGSIYLKEEDLIKAEEAYKKVLNLSPNHLGAYKNLGYILIKQNRSKEAENLLKKALDNSFDKTIYELLSQIQIAGKTGIGDFKNIEFELTTESAYMSISGDVSGFMQFFLDRANLTLVVPVERLQNGNYSGEIQKDIDYDLRMAEKFAKDQRTKRPAARAEFYLAAAKIVYITDGDSNDLNKYLYRCFVSMGDAAVEKNLHLDTTRQFYLEAAHLYGKLPSNIGTEQDVVNAVVRYLYASFNNKTLTPMAVRSVTIEDTLTQLMQNQQHQEVLLDCIASLVIHSYFAERIILKTIYNDNDIKCKAIDYLKNKGIKIDKNEPEGVFVGAWSKLKQQYFDIQRSLLTEVRTLNTFELTRRWLDDNIKRVTILIEHNFELELDRERIRRISQILHAIAAVLEDSSYETQDNQIERSRLEIKALIKEIEESPTKFSIEELSPVLNIFLEKTNTYYDELYEKSKPQITLRLPDGFDTLFPDGNQLEVQVVVSNASNRSPAEGLKLVIEANEEQAYDLKSAEHFYQGVLRGGGQDIITFPMYINQKAIDGGAFSFNIRADYQTIRGESQSTQKSSFQINLDNRENFVAIDNPYRVGAIVDDPKMFYGREDLINKTITELKSYRDSVQGYSYVIYGQKRTGKSSILHYLGVMLQEEQDYLVLDLGNIGAILNQDATNTYEVFLWEIIRRLKTGLSQLVIKNNWPKLNDIPFPGNGQEFFEHHSPHSTFLEIFDCFQAQKSSYPEWEKLRVIILIDEFTYLYDQIKMGHIPETLMTNWKAFLQANYFDAVLIGQDFMPKFIKEFENQFAAMQVKKVTYLEEKDAQRLIEEPIFINDKTRYRENAVKRILDLTSGSPFYTQMFCKNLVEYLNKKKAPLITEAYIEDVKNQLIRELNKGQFNNLYNSEEKTDEETIDTIKVLQQIAFNSSSGLCSKRAIDVKTSLPLEDILESLIERDVVKKVQNHYFEIKVGLFKEWLLSNDI